VLIINADDFGRSARETDAIVASYRNNRITSTTAMMFMSDSERAAELANGTGLEVGLHLNLSQAFATYPKVGRLREYHERIVRFMTASKYSLLVYHPALRRQFRYVYDSQLEEFTRLYDRLPSHIDGHQHRHLCVNVLVDGVIPRKQRVRRSFSFEAGDKSVLNRGYRRVVDFALARRYQITDFFFSLQWCLETDRTSRVFELARNSTVELMTHPLNPPEFAYLMSETYHRNISTLEIGNYSMLN
jgi:predicted glycoside hydrolase/deacetylase ChbG (UPF0249 family)